MQGHHTIKMVVQLPCPLVLGDYYNYNTFVCSNLVGRPCESQYYKYFDLDQEFHM